MWLTEKPKLSGKSVSSILISVPLPTPVRAEVEESLSDGEQRRIIGTPLSWLNAESDLPEGPQMTSGRLIVVALVVQKPECMC